MALPIPFNSSNFSVYAARYFRRLGIKAYVAYLFHHDSPYRKPNHLTRVVVSQIKEVLAGKRDKITIHNPSYRKEWGYAKDIVRGIFTLASQDNVFEATIGTGVAHTIYDFHKECLEQSGLSIEANSEFLTLYKDSKIPHLVSDPQTINNLGWQHSTDLASLARILLSASDQI
ncbi:MAG: GDP-mannose 4,6-dehydratase [Cyanobium sp.]